MSDSGQTPYEKKKEDFSTATDLAGAVDVVWNRPADPSATDSRGMFQHYTSLGRVLEKIVTGRWYLTRCDSKRLNDLKEADKYGIVRKDRIRRTYILCLGNGAGENVAMWGLYGHNDPLAMRISIPRPTVEKWMRELAAGDTLDVRDRNGRALAPSKLEKPEFHDMIYVAVQDKEIVDEFDIRRTNTLGWEGATCRLDKKSDLKREIKNEAYAGWLKDYEWRHERESRLCLRLKREIKDEAISISVPDYVIDDMRFTFSPWLEDENVRRSTQATIEAALASRGQARKKSRFQRFRRSVLQGALNFSF